MTFALCERKTVLIFLLSFGYFPRDVLDWLKLIRVLMNNQMEIAAN